MTWRRIIASALWVSLASTANADFCRSARQAITYEALIASGDEISAAMIADLHETAASLVDLAHKHRPPLDGAALQAVQEYGKVPLISKSEFLKTVCKTPFLSINLASTGSKPDI